MAFGGNESSGGAISDINVTPLVDVMLVLLVIFMVTAPILQSGVAVDLPPAASAQLGQQSDDLVVSIDAKGTFYVGDDEVDDGELEQRLQAAAAESSDRRVFVRADAGVEYGRVMMVLDAIRRAGLPRVGLATRPPGD
jgi:biopolymer transport protein TolR